VPLTLDQIIEETRQLPADVVAELIDRILLARHGGNDPEVEAAWKNEIDRRVEEIETGKVEGIPVHQSLARIAKSQACEARGTSRSGCRVC
jgi:putative addiction module component (TIGR02574 family)